jgi:hypothetical protein
MASMRTIEVRCAICGYQTVVALGWNHRKGAASEPKVWICETHR